MSRRSLVYLSLETPLPGQAAHTHVHEIVRGLRAEGWSVELVTSEGGGASAGRGMIGRGLGYLRAYVKAGARLFGADALYLRSHFAAWPVAMLARMLGKPVFHEINGRPADFAVTYSGLSSFAGLVTWLYRSQYRRAQHLFPVTDGLAAWARDFAGHERVTVIANAANTKLFTPEGPVDGRGSGHAIFVGGLVAWHGVATMLAALDDPAWPEGVRLVVVGDGIERHRLEARAGHPKLDWLGRIDQPQVPGLLRGALCALCVISDPDGRSATGVAPLKLFEAMASGAAVIVSDLPFQAELVRRTDAGLVVPPDDPAALAQAVATLAADPAGARVMGQCGADHVRAHASWRQRARETSDVMAACLDDRGAS